jgi:hypothetical protein
MDSISMLGTVHTIAAHTQHEVTTKHHAAAVAAD